MHKYLKVIISLILFCNCLPSSAEVISILSLEEALHLAINNNPEFKAKTINLDIREAEIKTAKARPNPSLLTDSGTAESTYRVGLTYNLELGGKRSRRTELSKTLLETEAELLNSARLDFRRDIRQAYTQLFYAKKRLEILRQVDENSSKLFTIAQKREKVGDIPLIEVSQVELSKISTENQYDKAIYQVQEARHQLEFLLNTELQENVELAPPNDLPYLPASLSMDNISSESLTEVAFENRPELKTSQLSQKIADQELAVAKSKRIPDLLVSAGPDFVTNDGGSFGAFIITQLTLPVFNVQKGAIEASLARKDQLVLEHQGTLNRLKAEVDHAYLAYVFQRKTLIRYEKKLLPMSNEILDKSYKSFELGKSSVLSSLQAQSDYMNIQQEYIQTLIDYQESISLLEKAIGVEL